MVLRLVTKLNLFSRKGSLEGSLLQSNYSLLEGMPVGWSEVYLGVDRSVSDVNRASVCRVSHQRKKGIRRLGLLLYLVTGHMTVENVQQSLKNAYTYINKLHGAEELTPNLSRVDFMVYLIF